MSDFWHKWVTYLLMVFGGILIGEPGIGFPFLVGFISAMIGWFRLEKYERTNL